MVVGVYTSAFPCFGRPDGDHLAMSARAQGTSAAYRVYRWLRGHILDGTIAGGRLLSEGEIAEAVQVSRTPVREAFLQLAAEGMLELYPKRGALVLTVTPAELREVVIARAVIEPWAAGVVAGRPDRSEVITELGRLTEAARVALSRQDGPAFQEADRGFHERLLAAAGNELLAGFYATLRDRQVRGGILAMDNDPNRGEEAIEQHDAIIAALERGDPGAASEAMTQHISGTAIALGLPPLR